MPSGLGAFCSLAVLPADWRLLRWSGRRRDLAAEQLLLRTCCVQVQRTPATSGPGDNSPALKGGASRDLTSLRDAPLGTAVGERYPAVRADHLRAGGAPVLPFTSEASIRIA